MDAPLIAVIDDDTLFLTFMDELLGGEGYRTVGCATTTDGFALIASTQPSLVILDLWMETRDAGWRLLERLRHDPRTAAAPIVVCSADCFNLTARADLLRSRRCAVLTKPFDLNALLVLVSEMTAPGIPRTSDAPRFIDWRRPDLQPFAPCISAR